MKQEIQDTFRGDNASLKQMIEVFLYHKHQDPECKIPTQEQLLALLASAYHRIPDAGSEEPEKKATRLVCSYHKCQWAGDQSLALSAPDPFNPGCTLIACPKCRDQTLVTCCDEPGCNQEASCGTPTETGYRQTCYKHIPCPRN